MGRDKNPAEEALILFRSRLCNPNFIFTHFSHSPDSNYSKLKFIISSSVTESCNNSALLLGPRGCGKVAVLELVFQDLLKEYPDMITVIKLNGLLHSDDNCALKEITRQLCVEHQLLYSKMASFDDNTQFMVDILRECGLAHKTVIFVLDEFDLFAQGKQCLLYSLLDAMQSVSSQAVVIGVSCRLDADQLLEKRVRSRFSHRKLLFLPPSKEDLQGLSPALNAATSTSLFQGTWSVLSQKKSGSAPDERSMNVPVWKRGLQFLQIIKQSIPAAVHSIVVQTPTGMARTHRFATETVDLPAQEGERVSIVFAAPSNVYRELPQRIVDVIAIRQQLLSQYDTLQSRIKDLREAAENEVWMLARMCQLENKIFAVGEPSYSAWRSRVERVREGLKRTLRSRIELIESYAKISSMIEIEVEMDSDVLAAEAASSAESIGKQIEQIMELENLEERWKLQAEANDEVERLLNSEIIQAEQVSDR